MKFPWRRKEPASAQPQKPAGISAAAVAKIQAHRSREFELTPIRAAPVVDNPFQPPKPPKGCDAEPLVMDDGFADAFGDFVNREGVAFLGYAFLAELSQRPEYRRMSEILAKEMTREWMQLVSTGDGDDGEDFGQRARDLKQQFKDADPEDGEALEDIRAQWQAMLDDQASDQNPKAEKLKAIAAEFSRLKVQDAFRRVAELDGFFGRGQIYLDTGKTESATELATPLALDRRKIRKGALKRIVVVEPAWSYPAEYNSNDPLRPDYYRPRAWYVMAKKVHASRLLTFVGRQLPDILKPAYAFSGLSLSQMAKPYVDNWLRTRQSVSDLVAGFTVWGIKTDLSAVLNGDDAEQLTRRADMFNAGRSNFGLMMLQKGMGEGDLGEEFFNVQANIAGLDKLQAQSQEQLASVSGIPLVKLLGITPSGLNASSDGEIRAFYDFIAAFQEQLFRDHLEHILKVVQFSLFGEIDPEIGFEFEPLWQLDETESAAARKADADIDCGYIDRAVLSAEEVRRKIASDRKSPYASIDVSDVPEPPEVKPGEDPEDDDPDRGQRSGGEGGEA